MSYPTGSLPNLALRALVSDITNMVRGRIIRVITCGYTRKADNNKMVQRRSPAQLLLPQWSICMNKLGLSKRQAIFLSLLVRFPTTVLAMDCPADLPKLRCRVDSVWEKGNPQKASVGDSTTLDLLELCHGGKATFQKQGSNDSYLGFTLRLMAYISDIEWSGKGVPKLELVTGGECVTDLFTVVPKDTEPNHATAEYVLKEGCGPLSLLFGRRKTVSIKLSCEKAG